MSLATLLWLASSLGCAVGFALCAWLTAGKIEDAAKEAYARGREAAYDAMSTEWGEAFDEGMALGQSVERRRTFVTFADQAMRRGMWRN